MAKATSAATTQESTTKPKIDESSLTKGQLRKLNALRKSVGEEIGEEAFAKWLETVGGEKAAEVDKNAEFISNTLWPYVESGELAIPRPGYLVKRGRKRLVVTLGPSK